MNVMISRERCFILYDFILTKNFLLCLSNPVINGKTNYLTYNMFCVIIYKIKWDIGVFCAFELSACSGSAKIATEGPVENANFGSTEKATT